MKQIKALKKKKVPPKWKESLKTNSSISDFPASMYNCIILYAIQTWSYQVLLLSNIIF